MPNPSAVALSAVNGDSVFYATTEGVEHAFRFEIGTSITQQTPLEGSPSSLVPVLTPEAVAETSLSLAPSVEAQVNPDQLFIAVAELPAAPVPNGPEANNLFQQPAALGSFDLLAFAEGGKGDSSDAWQRLVEGWQKAQSTWGASVQESTADGWAFASVVVRDAADGTEALVTPLFHFTSLEGLRPPEHAVAHDWPADVAGQLRRHRDYLDRRRPHRDDGPFPARLARGAWRPGCRPCRMSRPRIVSRSWRAARMPCTVCPRSGAAPRRRLTAKYRGSIPLTPCRAACWLSHLGLPPARRSASRKDCHR